MSAAGDGLRKRGFFGSLPRNVYLLGWTSFFTDAGTEMILPVLPLFLKCTLGAPMAAIGLIEGIAEGVSNLMKVGSGYWADRIGRSKPFVFAGYAISAVMKPLLALAPVWQFVLVVRLAERFGKGVRTAPRDSLVAASASRENYGKVYGFHRSMDTAGAVCGCLVSAVAMWFIGDVSSAGVRWLFVASVIPSAIALVFAGMVREKKRMAAASSAGGAARPALRLTPSVRALLGGIALWELANVSNFFVLLRFSEMGVPDRWIPIAYLGFNVVYMLAAMPVGVVTDRVGVRTMLKFGPLAGAAAFLALSLSSAWIVMSAGLVLFGLHRAVVRTVPRAGVAEFAPEGSRGTVFGLTGICAFAGNTVAGVLWQWLGAAAALRAAGAVSLLSLAAFAFLPRRERD